MGKPKVKGDRNRINSTLVKKRLQDKVNLKSPEKTICFTAIMKNEGANVKRCLDAAKNILDFVCITDTGSTDNTVEEIKKWGEINKIPTTVHLSSFVNFSVSRTESVTRAKQTYPQADYHLLLDADMCLQINTDNKVFDKKALYEDLYLVEQFCGGVYEGSFGYWNTRLISSKLDWICRGVTHEYWEPLNKDNKFECFKIRSLRIDDRNDGGCKSDKYERDERLLLKGLEEETDNGVKTRYKFYLAQTYKDMGKKRESTTWYKKRIADAGWQEEVYISKLTIGRNYIELFWKYENTAKALARINSGNSLTEYDDKELKKSLKEIQEYEDKRNNKKNKKKEKVKDDKEKDKVEDDKVEDKDKVEDDKDKEKEKDKVEDDKEKEKVEDDKNKDKDEDDINDDKILEEVQECQESQKTIDLSVHIKLCKSRAVKWLNRASKYSPHRNEANYSLAKFLREIGDNKESQTIVDKCKNIPYPNHDNLFIDGKCYLQDYWLYETCINCFYIGGRFDEGRKACLTLIENNKLSRIEIDRVRKNLAAYI